MPLPRAGRPTARAVESVKASAPLQTAARRPLVVVVVVVVVVRTPTPNYLRQASQNLGKYFLAGGISWQVIGSFLVTGQHAKRCQT